MAPRRHGKAMEHTVGHSAEYYKQMEAGLDVLTLTQRVYKASTEDLQSWIKNLWDRYCIFTEKDPLITLKEISINVLYVFFDWLLSVRKDSVGAASTLQTYWNVFCLVRKKETGCQEIDPLVKSQMQGVRQQLAIKYGLRTEKKKKPIMRAEDEFELLKTLYLSSEMTFNHERHRVQLALIMQLAGITGNRPAALLAVCYRHVKVTLLPDPHGGERPRVLVEIVYQYTKGYLGEKDVNEFGIPDVPNEPCLLLCPHITLLALIFADHAFAAPELTSAEQLFRLRVPAGQKQLELPLKGELQAIPLFRRCKSTVNGVRISDEEALADSTLRPQMITLGSVTGMELPTGPYTFRRGNGEALDNSSFITESQRNLVLQHHNSSVFQKNYASRYMPDTQAAYRGLEPQTALMRAASGMSRTIDRRRPRRLTAAQQAEVNRHPEVKLLRRRLQSQRQWFADQKRTIASMKGTPIYDRYQEAYRAHRNIRRRHEEVRLKEVKARYKTEQPVIDIQRQLRGLPIVEQDRMKAEDYIFAERVRAIETLFTFATSSPKEECKRRVQAIDAVTALCSLQEGRGFRRRERSASEPELEKEDTTPTLSESLPLECKPTQCIFCLGDEELPAVKRLWSYHSHGDLKKHFHRKHLRHHPEDQPITCPHPKCHVDLTGTLHLQNHAALVHKTPT